MPTALITGVTGQDGCYLAQLLLQKGYRVVGLLRRSSSSDVLGERLRWPGVEGDVELRGGDLIDISSLGRVISDAAPDEVYNLGAQSFVATSTAPHRSGCRDGRAERPQGSTYCAPSRSLLPGVIVGNIRKGPGDSPERTNAVLSAQSLCCREAVRSLDDHKSSRELRPARIVRNSIQS